MLGLRTAAMRFGYEKSPDYGWPKPTGWGLALTILAFAAAATRVYWRG